MNIALVWPKSTFLIDPMVYPPLGLWYVWAALRDAGHTARFFDLSDGIDDAILWEAVQRDMFNQVWVSGTSPQAGELRRIGRAIKAINPQTKRVLGGPHAWLHGTPMAPYYDLVVRGEVFTVEDVKQILRIRGEQTLKMRPALGDVPLPVRDAATRYHATLAGQRCATMITSLGCPYHCAFCSTQKLWGPKVRVINARTLYKDIDNLKEMGFGAIQFYDDILPIRPKRTLKLAAHLASRGMIWRCFMRSDLGIRHGRDFLAQLRIDGLKEILVGVESASDVIKANVNKGTTTAQDTTLREWCSDLGISYKASIILGLPGETWETMMETRQWLLDNEPDRADINVLIPMPGTPLYDDAEKYDCRWTVTHPDEHFFKGKPGEAECLVETASLRADEILQFRNDLVAELAVPY